MKINKVIILIVFVLISIMFVSCKKSASKIKDVNEFDGLFQDALKYDIRSNDECEIGHIKGFLCMGGEGLDSVCDTISTIIKDKKRVIILMGTEDDCLYVFNYLGKKGYKHMYYFEGGYENYVSLKGDGFTPEVGCDC